MKVNPQQAPLYGKCVLTVQLSDEELAQLAEEDVGGAELLLLFTGSRQRHLSSAVRTQEHGCLQVLCPAHDCCEAVLLTLCLLRPTEGSVEHLGQSRLQFVQDLAFDMAQFLVSTVGRADALDGVMMLDECHIPLQECERLDHTLALALTHIHLPDGWSLLGAHLDADQAPEPQETLLHFACGRGLQRVAAFLLRQRGAVEALQLPNRQGQTPVNLAESHGHSHLLDMLNRDKVTVETESKAVPQCHLCPGVCMLTQEPQLGTYTLKLDIPSSSETDQANDVGTDTAIEVGSPIRGKLCLGQEIAHLCRLIWQHKHESQGGAIECLQHLEECVAESTTGLAQQQTEQDCSDPAGTPDSKPSQESEESLPSEELHLEREEAELDVDKEHVEPEQFDSYSSQVLGLPLTPTTAVSCLKENTHSHASCSHTSPEADVVTDSSEELDSSSCAKPPPGPAPERSEPIGVLEAQKATEEGECANTECNIAPASSTTQQDTVSPGEKKREEKHEEEEHEGVKKEVLRAEEKEEDKEELEEEKEQEVNTVGEVVCTSTSIDNTPTLTSLPAEDTNSDTGLAREEAKETQGPSPDRKTHTAQSFICPAQGAAQGEESSVERDRGPPQLVKEEEEQLVDQKHPSGLGGLADAAEVGEGAKSPKTAAALGTAKETHILTQADGSQSPVAVVEPYKQRITATHEQAVSDEAQTPVVEGLQAPTAAEESIIQAGAERGVASVDMGLTQSLQEAETSDTESREMEGEEEAEESGAADEEVEEEEREISREESEEYIDASSTSMEGDVTLFVECVDCVLDSPFPSPQPLLAESPCVEEQVELRVVPSHLCMPSGSAQPQEGDTEAQSLLVAEHINDLALVISNEVIESPVDGQINMADGDGTSLVLDSGCDLPILTVNLEMTSLEGSSDTHPNDLRIETDSPDALGSLNMDLELHVRETTAENVCEMATLDPVSDSIQEECDDTDEDLPSQYSPDSLERSEVTVEKEAESDMSVAHSEESRPASSDDTLEALDRDSSTMSEGEQQKSHRPKGQPEQVSEKTLLATSRVPDRNPTDVPTIEVTDTNVCDISSTDEGANADSLLGSVVLCDAAPAMLEEGVVGTDSKGTPEGLPSTHADMDIVKDHLEEKRCGFPVAEPRERVDGVDGDGAKYELDKAHTLRREFEVGVASQVEEEEKTDLTTFKVSRPQDVKTEVSRNVVEDIVQGVKEEVPEEELSLLATPTESKQEVPEETSKDGPVYSCGDGALPSAAGNDAAISKAKQTMDDIDTTQSLVGSHCSQSQIHREKDSIPALPDTLTHLQLEKATSVDSTDSPQSSRSSISTLQRDSGSDTDGFCSTDTGEDNVFRKGDDTVTGDSTSEVSVSCSSTDDAASLGHPSSSSSSSSSSCSSRLPSTQVARRLGTGGGVTGVSAGGLDTEEEAKDCISDAPLRSVHLRSSIRSLSPFRRHSWGPGKNSSTDGDMNQRSTLADFRVARSAFHRRSLSWCPSELGLSPCVDQYGDFSLSLEGLVAAVDGPDGGDGKSWQPHPQGPGPGRGHCQGQGQRLAMAGQQGRRVGRQESDERGSLVSLTEEEHESDLADSSSMDSQKSRRYQPVRRSIPSMTLPLTKSVSMLAISQRDTDGLSSFASTTGSVDYSITEEEPGPLKVDFEGKTATKVSRTFSYLKSKMYKKTREKDKDRHKDKETKQREKRTVNGHLFSHVGSYQSTLCPQCHKGISSKEVFVCSNCYVCVHKGCRESLPDCAKMTKQQHYAVPDSSTLPSVTLRPKSLGTRDRPWSAILSPEEHTLATTPRRHTLMPFNSSNLSKSISISNIAGPVFDEIPLKGLRYLSQSTDSLHKPSKVNESTESLVDEGTEMIDSQLMGEFEADARELEAESWSFTTDKKFLKQLKKDTIKRQDVIYELMQTELHHVRTLRVMAEVYCKGLQKEVQLEGPALERMFPMLDELLELHTHFLSNLLERRRDAQLQAANVATDTASDTTGFVIERIGDVLIAQFSGPSGDCMKRVYGKFCSRHNEAVNLYKEHHAKDKRFQAFIKRKMSSSIVRRMGIPECILLVTQRITKYPVLLQRLLQNTKEFEEDHSELSRALSLVREVIGAVDRRVSEQERRRRLKEIHGRTDSKSIMRMRSGQMFAREDLLRGGRRLIHDGPLQLKNSTGRLKDVQALLLSDILVFLQEKDQKYVFASLDQRATVISLQKLIVREVANEERALFLITAGTEKPEMVEVHASSKDERNTWMQLLQDAMQSIGKDEDEGVPSETEEDKRIMESKAKELREMLRKKDDQIVSLLQEKMKLFWDMCECGPADDSSPGSKMLFRASSEEVPKGEPIMKRALKEVETLQILVNGSLGGAVGQQVAHDTVGGVGPVSLPRRAETFGGFDSHQMSLSKNGEKEEGEDISDLRRTESDSVLKKGGNANLLLLLKRNSEQVLQSVTNLHDQLNSLQAVVVQQDTFIEDQRQALLERTSSSSTLASTSTSITSSSSRPSSRPSSLIEQERQRSLEKQRQEVAALQRQREVQAEERRKLEHQWEVREGELTERESQARAREDELQGRKRELEEAKRELLARKEDYQRDLERLRDGQRRLERDKESLRREMEALETAKQEQRHIHRTPSSTSEESLKLHSGGGNTLETEAGDTDPPRKNSLSRGEPKSKGRTLNPFGSRNQTGSDGANQNQTQMPSRLLQLTKSKDKRKKKSKHPLAPESQLLPLTEPPTDGEIYFC